VPTQIRRHLLKTPSDLEPKLKNKIIAEYPALEKDNLPEDYRVTLLEYRKNEIAERDTMLWHRLLKRLYQGPLEIECEFRDKQSERKEIPKTAIFRKTNEEDRWEVTGIDEEELAKMQNSITRPFPINWKYFISLPSGGVLELGTQDRNTVFYIAQMDRSEDFRLVDDKEAEHFIDLILQDANRLREQLFNPEREFKRQDGLRAYHIFNVYLSNYRSAVSMLDIAGPQEALLKKEYLRYDARTDLHDENKMNHIDQHMLTCGMFFCSAITYLFAAFEGFVNIVFHAFLRNRFRDKDLGVEKRLDLEQKLRFMPSLCSGFKDFDDVPSILHPQFKMLKNYRNSIFHANIEDALKLMGFVEDGFVYHHQMDAHKPRFLPAYKMELTMQDVIDVKNIVDEMIASILESMNDNARMVTETYIMKEPFILFTVSDKDGLVVGKGRGA